jgi:nucleotide-binding universal stress UspA family protein
MAPVPQSVLVAVDFGEASASAVAVGGFIAGKCRASLRLLHAETIEAPPYFTSDQMDQLERQRQTLRGQAEQFLARFGQQHTTEPFSMVIVEPPPADAIIRTAATADLVVMGTHGRHGPKRWWLGSVAERVLRDLPRPLLIVRADVRQPASSLFDRALVHAAAPLVGATALRVAREFAATCGGETIDGRHDLIEPAIGRAQATVLVAAVPTPRNPGWLADYGEPLVRFCPVPILFVPETKEGTPS